METPQTKLVSQELIAEIPSAVDSEIAQAINVAQAINNAEGEKRKLFSNLIADPYAYKNLSPSDKILVTQAVIEDLIRLPKPDQTNKDKDPINKTLTRISEAGKDSFFDEYEAIAISNYYVRLHQATEKQIPVETKQPSNFQCQRGGDPGTGGAGGGEKQSRRSQNAFNPPPSFFNDSQRMGNRTSAQQERSQEMRARMCAHIQSSQKIAETHPAGLRPITNIPKSPSNRGLGTGIGAMKDVLNRGFTTQYALITGYNPRGNNDGAIAGNLKNAHSSIKEQLELTRRALEPDIENGSINERETKNLRKELTALKNLEKENRKNSDRLAAINFLTQPLPPKRRPSSAPRQPLSARSASLSNGTGRR